MMAQLSRSEIDNDQLPPLCVCCGRPTELFKDRVFTWHPWWVYSFLLLAILPYFVVRWSAARRWTVRLPLCRRHRYHWAWRRAVFWGSSILGISLMGIGLGLGTHWDTGGGEGLIGAGCMVLTYAPFLYIGFRETMIRAGAMTSDRITLKAVSARFTMALQQARQSRGEQPTVRRCAGCGLKSALLTAFRRHGRRLYCPRCFERRHLGGFKIILLAKAAVGVAGLVLVVLASAGLASEGLRPFGWLLLNLFLLFAFQVLVILPHEAGHALATWLLGARVFSVWVGLGKTVVEIQLGKVKLEVKRFPVGGLTFVGHPDVRHYRLKQLLIVLAGPLVNAGPLAALWVCVPPGSWRAENLGAGLAPAFTFFVANLIVLVVNLFPIRVRMGDLWVALDGLALLTLPFVSRATVGQVHALYFIQEGEVCRNARRYDQAAAWYERGLACYPEDLLNRFYLGLALAQGKQFERARREWLVVLGRADLDPQVRAVVLTNLAEVNLWVDPPEAPGREAADLLGEADRFSAEALQSVPWLPNSKGTRGMVLTELGQLDEGMPLLQQAFQEHQDAEGKATCACFLALAEIRQGHSEEARTYVETAQQLDPDCFALEKVLKELAGAQPVPEVRTS